jgi:hypothetical protein
MASHFSDIGFVVASSHEVLAMARSLPVGTPVITTPAGEYVRWSAGGGAELWFQRAPDLTLVGMNPHFDVETRTRVRLVSRVDDPVHKLDGGFHLWLDPHPPDPEFPDGPDGASPLFVDTPDMRTYDAVQLPLEVDATIAAFAHRLELFGSEAELRATGSIMAAESLIPSGLFFPGGDERMPATAEAIFQGIVEATETRQNVATGREFLWARVRTYGARLEVVADPTLASRPPIVGDILGGTFWMSARFPGIVSAGSPPTTA